MNFKVCTFERLAVISLGFGRGAQVGEKFTFESEFMTAQALTLGVFIVRLRPWDPTKTLAFGKKMKHFLQCEAKIVSRHTSSLRVEPVSFLLLVCL